MKTSDILREYAKDFGDCGPQYAAIVENLKMAAEQMDARERIIEWLLKQRDSFIKDVLK